MLGKAFEELQKMLNDLEAQIELPANKNQAARMDLGSPSSNGAIAMGTARMEVSTTPSDTPRPPSRAKTY